MKKYIYSLLSGLLLLGSAFTQMAQAQSLQLDIRNQQYVGDTLFFDVYMARNGGSSDYYIGNADFALTFNNGNFSSPTIGMVTNSSVLKSHTGAVTTSYDANIATAIGTSNPNTNKILLNVLQPSFSNQADFEARIARVGTATETHRLGRFWIKGVSDVTQSPNLAWVTSGAGTRTKVFTLDTGTPWKSSRITSYTANNPAVGAEPTTAPTALSITSKTDTTMALSWTRGNGGEILLLAKEGSAVGSDFPTDGILYDANDSFGGGSQIDASGVFVIYRGTGTSVTLGNLDPSTHYFFTALELNGSGGYSENYYTSSVATASDTTKAGEPTVSASDLLFTAWGTSTLDLSWTNGNGANRIIVAKAGAAVSVDPTDAVAYTVTNSFTTGEDLGSGNIVVYDGSGTSIQVTNLNPAVDYHFAVYEYNGTAGSRNYKTSTPATGNRSTLQTEPTAIAYNPNFSNVATTSMTFSFNAGNGSRSIILVKSGAAVDSIPSDGREYTANTAFGSGDVLTTGNYVVYFSDTNFVNVSGLTANTTYHYAVFTVNAANDSTNYLTSSYLTDSKTTLFDEPTVSATALDFTAWSTTTLDLEWTNGDGANRIVVAREGSAVDFSPIDTNAYTANASFGTGTGLGGSSDNYVVYNGSGSTFQITNLDPAVEYFFAVYEYNGASGAQNYKTTTPATGNRSTLQTEPTSIAYNPNFSNVATTSMTFSFNAGNGSRSIILVKSGAAVDSIPSDGREYTANTAFGSGDVLTTGNYVVYFSDTNFVNVSGLTANTTYHYAVFTVNAANDSTNYLTSSYLTDSKTTLFDEPTVSATALDFTAWSTTTLDLEWTNGDGANRIVVAREGSAVDFSPVDTNAYTANASFGTGTGLGTGTDNYVIYNGSGSSVQVTNLDPAVRYYFAVYEYNGASGAQNYKTTTPATGDRYTLETEPTTASTGGAGSGITTTSMTISWSNGNGAEQMLVLRAGSAVSADPVDGLPYSASSTFGGADSVGTGQHVVYRGTGASVTVTDLEPNTTYYYEIFELNGSGESANYLTSPTLTGDEITLQDAPTVAASSLLISEVGINSMKLDWTSGNGASRVVVARAFSSVSADPVDGTTYTANATFGSGNTTGAGEYVVYNGTGSSVTVTGLFQDTVYTYAVYEYNGTAGSENFLTTTPATNGENTAFKLNLALILEGPYNGTDMDTLLNEIDSIPLTHPYGAAPWSYSGTASVTAVPIDVVDWVYVQIRNSNAAANATSDSIVAEQAGFLLSNGRLVDSNSNEMTILPSKVGNGQMYVVVYHRNHIGVMSAAALTFNSDSGAYVFDFTSGAAQAHGTGAQVLSGSKYVLYGGNSNATGTAINGDDRDDTWDARNGYGYLITDTNLDGIVDSGDRSIIYNNTGQDEQIP